MFFCIVVKILKRKKKPLKKKTRITNFLSNFFKFDVNFLVTFFFSFLVVTPCFKEKYREKIICKNTNRSNFADLDQFLSVNHYEAKARARLLKKGVHLF